ncbi:hypothetical protein ACVWXO_005808 [Bradyrhizobium sp. LM2.7]
MWTSVPLNVSCPGNTDVSGADSMPQQVIRNWASMVSPVSVVIVQRWVASLKTALVTVVLKRMSLRRSSLSAT